MGEPNEPNVEEVEVDQNLSAEDQQPDEGEVDVTDYHVEDQKSAKLLAEERGG